MLSKIPTRLIILLIIIAAPVLFWSFTRSKVKDYSTTNCITNKDQAVDLLLRCDGCPIDTETASYVKGVEARGNKVFFDETPDTVGEPPSFNTLEIGEELENGSKLLHSRYSYKLYACDIDLDKEDIGLSGSEKKYQFSFTNNDETQDQFIDETITCGYTDPTTEVTDIDGDNQKEVLVNCNSGAASSAAFLLYVYNLNNNKLEQIGLMDSEGKYDIKDCDSDGIKDIVTYLRDVEFGDGGNSTWKHSVYCNHWDKQSTKFIETKISEE